MSINTVQSVSANIDIQSITSSQANRPAPAPDLADASGVSVSMSSRAQAMSQLDSLATSDPDKFKAVTADIAAQLSQAAASQTGGAADFLKQLADRFQNASQSGKASDLAPPSGKGHGHGGGHHHHHVHAAAGAAGTDPSGQAATNQPSQQSGIGATVESIISTALAND